MKRKLEYIAVKEETGFSIYVGVYVGSSFNNDIESFEKGSIDLGYSKERFIKECI